MTVYFIRMYRSASPRCPTSLKSAPSSNNVRHRSVQIDKVDDLLWSILPPFFRILLICCLFVVALFDIHLNFWLRDTCKLISIDPVPIKKRWYSITFSLTYQAYISIHDRGYRNLFSVKCTVTNFVFQWSKKLIIRRSEAWWKKLSLKIVQNGSVYEAYKL